jgi:hypothetical protein
MKLVKKATTLTDVAMDAGVSPYTASVVLNGSRSNTRVSEATRQRILASAARLNYYPNAMARAPPAACAYYRRVVRGSAANLHLF